MKKENCVVQEIGYAQKNRGICESMPGKMHQSEYERLHKAFFEKEKNLQK